MMLLALALLLAPPAFSTDLFLRGHAVIPTPQKTQLEAGEVCLDESWSVDAPAHIAARTLAADLAERFRFPSGAPAGASGRTIRLRVRNGAVNSPVAETRDQAYRLRIAPESIEITGNGGAGLFYGVQTLLQLIKPGPRGELLLPRGVIEDWPQLKLRFLHWDSKHHQDRVETLKRYLDWAARFKVNMIGFEVEDKFAYPSHPTIGAPGAFTPAQMQQIVDYGLERYIQVVPIVQSPAHMSYVLKHPQYARLRADGNNYQSCLCLEDTYRLIFQMYDDLIAATKGVDYFFVSTDEVYYAGIGANCKEPYTPHNRSARWAEFATRARNHLAGKGRRMLAWLEYPLLAKHLEQLPADIIDGVVGDRSFFDVERRKGMRSLIYVSMQGAEFLFPDYFPIATQPVDASMGEFEQVFSAGRLETTRREILERAALKLNPIGLFGAAWDDSGLHGETFWLGWSAAARWAWQPGVPGPDQHAAEFMRVYYGPEAVGMTEVYRMLQGQARAWQRSWMRVTSRVRGPGYGNSDGKGIGTTRHDLTLTRPALPQGPALKFQPAFLAAHGALVAEAAGRSQENDRLRLALAENLLRASRNRYNLEVLTALAEFTGHHWKLVAALASAERALERAAQDTAGTRYAQAVGRMVEAHNQVARMEKDAAQVRRHLETVWEKSRFPKGMAAGGRKFVHVLDDTKDHFADRTPDMGFLFAPEQSIGLANWRAELSRITSDYARRHSIPVRGLAEPRLEQ